MTHVVTIRLNENHYKLFKNLAEQDNRTLSNFIETSTLKTIENESLVDDFEMNEILNNGKLIASLKRGAKDYREGKGSFVEL